LLIAVALLVSCGNPERQDLRPATQDDLLLLDKYILVVEGRINKKAQENQQRLWKSCDLMRQGVHALAASHPGKARASRLVDEACEVLR
jgi:hypothetical protein